ncbi:MAG: 3-hydroxy-5-phosphonooxypentane-2,4-dione thiolase LsrF, partial [Spirochaetales bacterium]|nr:3-hydroxy-5-phosphonooxypentane-2,4-dione thiolase LsrF [Spirochaetales bacterium]
GVDMGRNIWQSEYPAAIIQGVNKIIHGNISVKEALQLVESLSNDATRRKDLFEVTKRDIADSNIH